ncbi:hypothetical protein D3C74_398400 [compost metagenome]
MHADLMRPPRAEAQLNPGSVAVSLRHLIIGQRGVTRRRHDPAMWLGGIAVDRTVDHPFPHRRTAMHERCIFFAHLTGDQLLGNMLVAVRVLGNHQHS